MPNDAVALAISVTIIADDTPSQAYLALWRRLLAPLSPPAPLPPPCLPTRQIEQHRTLAPAETLTETAVMRREHKTKPARRRPAGITDRAHSYRRYSYFPV
jgi:hypothetical protein